MRCLTRQAHYCCPLRNSIMLLLLLLLHTQHDILCQAYLRGSQGSWAPLLLVDPKDTYVPSGLVHGPGFEDCTAVSSRKNTVQQAAVGIRSPRKTGFQMYSLINRRPSNSCRWSTGLRPRVMARCGSMVGWRDAKC